MRLPVGAPWPRHVEYAPSGERFEVRPGRRPAGQRDPYHQNYEFFRGRRDHVRRLLRPAWSTVPGPAYTDGLWGSDARDRPGPTDVVIHVRVAFAPWHICSTGYRAQRCSRKTGKTGYGTKCPAGPKKDCLSTAAHPPVEYFQRILADRESVVPGAVRPECVWLVADPEIARSGLMSKLRTGLVDGSGAPVRIEERVRTAHDDLAFVANAAVIVTTGGTFGWFAAFLSSAREVHVPYTRAGWEQLWWPSHALFVDDQPGWWYHDIEAGGASFSNASTVLAEPSAFARAVAVRPREVAPAVLATT